MRIIIGQSKLVEDLTCADLDLIITAEHIADFKKLVARGTNTWPDAPPAIKQLHDLLYHGRILQKY